MIAFCSLLTALSLAAVSFAAERAPWERTAEGELDSYLKRVAPEGVRIGGKKAVFHVGDTDFAKGKGLASSAFKDEEWCVKSFGADVVLNGGGTRGALYAVSHFLEDDCGVRWWNDGDEDVPEKGRIDFPALDRRGKPFFAYREIYRTPTATIDPRTAVRMRLNGNGERKIPLAWGGGVEFGPPYFTHVWDRYLPFAKYGKEHPEWYSYREKEGKRVGGIYTGQLCLTNPELVPLLVKLVKKSIVQGEEEAKAKGLAAPTIYALNMNDNRNYCECEACKAEVAKYGHSGQQLRFINAIAAEVGKDRPDLRFKFSAYLYTEEPPKGGVKAADNVIVDIAMTQTNLAGPIGDSGNDHIREMPVRWRDASHQFLVWDYGITFWPTTMGWPFPSEFHLPGKMRHFADCKVTHFFIEHEHPETADMYELKLYLERKLLEDPYADGDGLVGTFMREYYGPASASVLAARTRLEDARRSARAQVSWFPRRHEFTWIDDATVAAMRGRFDEAEKAVAGNGKLLQRVRRARTSIDRVAETRRTFRDYAGRYPAKTFNPQDKKAMALVDAADALDGKALRIRADGARYSRKSLVTCGYALGGGSGTLAAETDEKEGEWRWYRASKLKASDGYIHCCNWQIQIETGLPGNKGRKTDLRVHMKLTGPNFFPGSTRPNEVLVDRIEELPSGGSATAGWENVCPERREFPSTEAVWRANPSVRGDFRVELRDGAKGQVSFGADGIRISKTNGDGAIVVIAKPFAAKKGTAIRFSADHVVSDADVDYSNGFLRALGEGGSLNMDWKAESENFWCGGQHTMRGLPCTAPGMTYRKFAQCFAKSGTLTPAIVVSGRPSESVWRDWIAEDVAAAQKAWQPHWDAKLSGDHSGGRLDETAFDALIAADRVHTAKVVRVDGVSRLLVDGEIAAPVLYKAKHVYDGSSRDGGDTFAGKPFDGSAVRLMVKEIRFGKVPGARGYWTKDGFDAKGAVREVKDAMRLAPKSLFVLALGCTAYPEFTTKEHPEETWIRKDGTPVLGNAGSCIVGYEFLGKSLAGNGPWPWVSPSSRLWRDAIRRCIRELMAELKAQGLDRRIVGVHLYGYHDGQFSIPYDDHSPCAKAEYARMIAEPGCLSTNYTFCLKQSAFRAQEEFAREFKRALGKDAVAVMWCESPFMGAINASVDVTSFARSDALDVIVCQSNYRERLPAFPTVSTIPTDSLHLHGKLFVNEFDLRTYGALESWANSWPSMKSLGHSEDFPMWQTVYRKLAGEADANRMGYWFYDMGGGWYEPPEIAADIRALVAERTDMDRRPRSSWRPDVATVLDEVNIIQGEGTSHPATDDYVYHHQCRYFGTCGAPYERYLAEDVLADPSVLDGKKVAVLAFFRRIDRRRAALLKRLAAQGTTLVFLSETGILGGAEEIRFEPVMKSGNFNHRVVAEPGVTDNVTSEMDTAVLRDRGASADYGPRCTVKETDGVRVLARYASDRLPAIAERRDADCRRVYVCEPGGLTPGLLNRIVRESGGYAATDRPGLQVNMNGDFISVHCLRPGTYDFRLPFDGTVKNLRNGAFEPVRNGLLKLNLTAGETCRFALEARR